MEKFSKIFAGIVTVGFIITMIAVIVIWPFNNANAQTGTRLQRHKLYDTSKVEDHQKIKRKRLTVDVDSTGIALYAWGDECYFKINLLERMLVNATSYEQGRQNGHPYIKYGNDNFKFRMYINKGGNFEFDAKILNKSPKGRNELQFNIQTKGLKFSKQPNWSIFEQATHNFFSPDSVKGSYAVYHSSRKNNLRRINGADTTFEKYGTGKAFHIYRPKVWDNAGNTVWGTIRIDTTLGRMFIGVDSTWMANAIYPVTIDPQVGLTTKGASVRGVNASSWVWSELGETLVSAGTLDSIAAYIGDGGPNDSAILAIYDEGADNLIASTAEQDCDGVTLLSEIPISGSVSTGINYTVMMAGNAGLLLWADDVGGAWSNWTEGTNSWPTLEDPASPTDFGDHFQFSIYFDYTVSGGGAEPIMRRRRNR